MFASAAEVSDAPHVDQRLGPDNHLFRVHIQNIPHEALNAGAVFLEGRRAGGHGQPRRPCRAHGLLATQASLIPTLDLLLQSIWQSTHI